MIMNKVGAVALPVLLALGVVVVTGGTAVAMPPQGYGSMTCAVTGVGKFSPKLTAAGSPVTAVKTIFKGVSVSGSCTGTAGIPNTAGTLTPVTISGAKFKGAGYYSGPANANSCPVFSSTDSVGAIKIVVNWIASPSIAKSVVTLSSPGSPVVSGSPTDTITLPSGATVAATGSFSSPPPTFLLSMVTNIVSACSTTWGPYPGYTFGTGSSLSI
ncbi:MAG TPA: hypothetical protein VNC61_13860 [Acidimicrobiales bacterium]|nr:hypothetical protein [Acidimicrobiales bacterium]